ncbi:hypothetical protein PCL_00979 [Purpureocillium lilacinum]|uniref:Uncharacterized protein n=1 Tax=Purpureocillium lilacinum TaxID=33203 RepID=A0A2U3E4A9_PURLI|nr:hypothetical protein Purlil1_9199 [Purpureocillium lilacinum]PWI69332.1 hypothetical protein PCL_00979 [Purpureocillium lilacinum]
MPLALCSVKDSILSTIVTDLNAGMSLGSYQLPGASELALENWGRHDVAVRFGANVSGESRRGEPSGPRAVAIGTLAAALSVKPDYRAHLVRLRSEIGSLSGVSSDFGVLHSRQDAGAGHRQCRASGSATAQASPAMRQHSRDSPTT